MQIEPSAATFAARYAAGEAQVVWTTLVADLETPVSAFLKIAGGRPMSFLLESVEGGEVRGRYSIIGLEPDVIFRSNGAAAEINRAPLNNPEAFAPAGAERVATVEAMVAAALPDLGPLIDVLRHRTGTADQWARRIFAQFADGTQLDLTVIAQADIEIRRRGGGAPDFIPLYQVSAPPDSRAPDAQALADGGEPPAARAVTGDQVREWAFLGWCALIDADKYLRRGSLWEAHDRLHQARHHIWALWAAAHGALYPWHGLSQVLDHDPDNLPPDVESTVAGLDAADLYRAARASTQVLATVSAAAAASRRKEPVMPGLRWSRRGRG